MSKFLISTFISNYSRINNLLSSRRSTDTILGNVGNRREIFSTENCINLNPIEIDKIVTVDRVFFTNWKKEIWNSGKASKNYFFQKRFV